jgi:Dynamin central region/Dynamin family/Dynamin GTPase effector domain
LFYFPLDIDVASIPGYDAHEWGEFAHKPGKKYFDFNEIRNEIIRETERTAGKNKGVTPEPIGLRIHSPRVPDLMIIDLPGITKVPVGDQPVDIEFQIREMCLSYARQPNTIILAISAANADLANSDAIKLALEVDPTTDRTIGVLTKLDLMDPGTDAREILTGRVVPLKRGFVPVVCRSQKDIADGMQIDRALMREKAFFERHVAYRPFAPRCGTTYLTRILSHMLLSAMKTWLPSVKTEISLMIQSAESQLRSLGDPVNPTDTSSQGQLLLRHLSRFATNFCDMVDGRVATGEEGDDLLTEQMFGGARIQEVIRSRFYCATAEWLAAFQHNNPEILPDAEILMALRNSSGPRPTLFIPEQAFVALVRRHIKSLRELGRKFVDSIYDELRRVADMCEPPGLIRFGDLREKAVEVVQALLRSKYTPTMDQVDRLVEIELSHVNTLHPDFIGADGALRQVAAEREARNRLGHQHPSGHLPGMESGYEFDHESGLVEALHQEEDEDDIIEHDMSGNNMMNDTLGPSNIGRAPSIGYFGSNNNSNSNVPTDVDWVIKKAGQALYKQGPTASSQHSEVEEDNPLNPDHAPRGRNGQAHGKHSKKRSPTPPTSQFLKGKQASNNNSNKNNTNTNNVRFVRDIEERFARHIVDEIAGYGMDEIIPEGAVRVGGSHSPFVARPRMSQSPHKVAGAAAAGQVMHRQASFQFPQQHISHVPGGLGPIGFGSPLKSPGSLYSHTVPVTSSANLMMEHPKQGYVPYALTTMHSRPLPSIITPVDLKATKKEAVEIRVIRLLVLSYLSIVRKSYEDMVPKIVIAMLVNKVKEEIQSELVHRLYASLTSHEVLLRETEDIASKRSTLSEHISMLQRANEILGQVRDFSLSTTTSNSSSSSSIVPPPTTAGSDYFLMSAKSFLNQPSEYPVSPQKPAQMTSNSTISVQEGVNNTIPVLSSGAPLITRKTSISVESAQGGSGFYSGPVRATMQPAAPTRRMSQVA